MSEQESVCVYVCVYVCVRARASVCSHMCTCMNVSLYRVKCYSCVSYSDLDTENYELKQILFPTIFATGQ